MENLFYVTRYTTFAFLIWYVLLWVINPRYKFNPKFIWKWIDSASFKDAA